jgi:uncharacterized protein (TIGR03067 family)
LSDGSELMSGDSTSQGIDLLQEGDAAQALELLSVATQEEPAAVDAWLAIAICGLRLGKCDVAFEALDQALRLQPYRAEAFAIRAELHGELENWVQAADDERSARRLRRDGTADNTLILCGKRIAISPPPPMTTAVGGDFQIRVSQSNAEVISERNRLQGLWRIVSMTYDGVPIDESVGMHVECQGDCLRARDQISADTILLDPHTHPASIDLINQAKTCQHGIYSVQDDRWTICYADIARQRPTSFAGRSGDQTLLIVFERVDRGGVQPLPA